VQSHGSANLVAAGTGVAAALGGPILVGVVALASWLAYREARRALDCAAVRATIVLLLGALACSKVLSPQFLLWIVPLVAVWPGRTRWALSIGVGAAGLLAQVWYPFLYDSLKQLEQPWITLLALRNVILVATFLLAVRGAARDDRAR